jgi:site-specific recombinase XerD
MPRSIHDLRHSRAQDLLRGGADLGTVKKFLRHRDIASTQVYLDDEEDAQNERRIAARSARFL